SGDVGFEQNAGNAGHDASQIFAKYDPAELHQLARNLALRSIAAVARGKFRRRLILDLSELLKNLRDILELAHLLAIAAPESLDPTGIGMVRRNIFGRNLAKRPGKRPKIYGHGRIGIARGFGFLAAYSQHRPG